MALHYRYTEYEDYPEATAISEFRSRGRVCLSQLFVWGIIINVLLLFASPMSVLDWIGSLSLIALCIGGLFYLIKYYDAVTEKKIKKAIEKSIAENKKTQEHLNASRYFCSGIAVSDKHSTCMCNVCYLPNVRTTLCEIKDPPHTRTTFICDSCINKFKSNAVCK